MMAARGPFVKYCSEADRKQAHKAQAALVAWLNAAQIRILEEIVHAEVQPASTAEQRGSRAQSALESDLLSTTDTIFGAANFADPGWLIFVARAACVRC